MCHPVYQLPWTAAAMLLLFSNGFPNAFHLHNLPFCIFLVFTKGLDIFSSPAPTEMVLLAAKRVQIQRHTSALSAWPNIEGALARRAI